MYRFVCDFFSLSLPMVFTAPFLPVRAALWQIPVAVTSGRCGHAAASYQAGRSLSHKASAVGRQVQRMICYERERFLFDLVVECEGNIRSYCGACCWIG